MDEFGVVAGPATVRLERLLPGPVERIWAYLTEPEKRGTWLAAGAMDLRLGGRVELAFRHADLSDEKTAPEKYRRFEAGRSLFGTITELDPPSLLAYTWGEGLEGRLGEVSEVRFELEPRGQRVLLVVTHRRLADGGEMANVASGWHTHLGILRARLEGRTPAPFWTTHAALERAYRRRMDADGT